MFENKKIYNRTCIYGMNLTVWWVGNILITVHEYMLLGIILVFFFIQKVLSKRIRRLYIFFILNMYMYLKLKGMFKLVSLTRINCPVRVVPSLYLYQIPFDQFVQYWLVMVLFTFLCHYLHTQTKQESRMCQFNNSWIYDLINLQSLI